MTGSTTVRRAATWTVRVTAWAVIVGIAAALAAGVLVPRVAGATPYTVLTGSMAPTYAPGDLVVVRPVDPEAINTGDAISYQLESGKPAVVTHRVLSQGYDGSGEVVLITKGDANEDADPSPVRAAQVKGEVWYSVPYLGYVTDLFTGRQRQLGVYAVAAVLIGYSLLSFVGAARDRRRTKNGKAAANV